jgi:hypothetical protein
MRGSDVNIIEFLPQGNSNPYTIFDGWSEKFTKPKPDIEMANGTDDLKNVEYKIVEGRPVVSYTRKLDTGDKYDKVVSLVSFFLIRKIMM